MCRWKFSFWPVTLNQRNCFNPCSFGCAVESLRSTSYQLPLHWFQSLFFWMCRWKAWHRGQRNLWSEMFQSLFFWMCRWKILIPYFIPKMVSVSILVLLDVPLKEITEMLQNERISSFQSLFFWMCHWKRICSQSRKRRTGGFNPCSFGCAIERCIACIFELYRQCVSILVLLDVPLKVIACVSHNLLIFSFQSLFFWMCRWKIEFSVYANRYSEMFQSLFFWMCRWKLVVFY